MEVAVKQPFDRQKFLLFSFLAIVTFQYLILTVGVAVCAYWTMYAAKLFGEKYLAADSEHRPGCTRIGDRLENTFDLSINVLLAMLGGAAIATRPAAKGFTRRADEEPPVLPPNPQVLPPDRMPPEQRPPRERPGDR
jgi:hypothetical protein